MRGISVLAILVGSIADFILSGTFGLVLVGVVISNQGLSKLPKDQLTPAVLAAIHGSPGLYAMQLAIGFGCSVFGGLLAALIAKQRKLLNAVLASWLCVGTGIIGLVKGADDISPPIHLLMVVMTPICYAAGAAWALRMRRIPTVAIS